MIDIVTRYTCDACHKTFCAHNEMDEAIGWAEKTEVGDLCPSCSNAWENYKQSFIEKMRIENKESLR